MDEYGIDSQKLIYHPQRVVDWLEGQNIYPIYIEVGPIARCMHRCVFCAFDYQKYKGPLLSETYCKIFIEHASEVGVKAMMYAGEGEPLLHPSILEMVSYTKMHNIDVSMTTNGVKLNRGRALNAIPFLDWLRFSVDAATPATYAKVHGCRKDNFDKLIDNIRRAVELKRELHSQCTIGTQAVLIPQNMDEIVDLAVLMRDVGVDYFSVKPFSKHPLSHCNFDIDYSELLFLEEKLQEVANNDFKVIFRTHTMEKLSKRRPYLQCLALPFVTYLDANGDLYACSAFLGNKDFVYGNIYEECFPGIWEGKRRQEVLKRVSIRGVENCREVCHLDEMNRYLWTLKYEPPQHLNFV